MTTRIIYSQDTQVGKILAQAVNTQLEAVEKLRRVKALLEAAQEATDDFAHAAEVGGGITIAEAQTLWTLVANAVAQVDVPASAVAQLANLDQG